MMTPEVESALVGLYRQSANRRSDFYETERIERALDELVNNPTRNTPATWQVRNARGNAAKVLAKRALIAPQARLGEWQEFGGRSTASDELVLFEIKHWLATTSALTDAERAMLLAVALDEDPTEVAAALGMSVLRLRERLSRARSKARAAWIADGGKS